ncbi:RAMP superfamily CRISPR-associated protein [Tolypothrix sp. VBCCA 56010]|uniref:RAMP superfamily CRISPR-associated protein n=1 Tax=Tolypothrix sp. VBCCA 56010 TaxID=3137731 RepID=UPI003D7D3BC4
MVNNIPNQNPIPTNPWLDHPLHRSPNPTEEASFVEYLRWMRIRRENSNDNQQINLVNNGEVLQLLDKLLSNNDYSDRLKKLTQRTQTLANVCFQAKATWRIRVGGMKGPESMLLPAFDALGMPYIPSTTLKGIAREMAERDLKAKPEKIEEIFGDLEPATCIRQIFGDLEPTAYMGQVVFLDAYPLPFAETKGKDESEGLVPDMANSIWTWDKNGTPQYKTNPNIFLSLRKPTFVIGLRYEFLTQRRVDAKVETTVDTSTQQSQKNIKMLDLVQRWLINGLAQGIGSRVNSGYGVLEKVLEKAEPQTQQYQPEKEKVILEVGFQLRGQMIHGRQNFNAWERKKEKPEQRGTNKPEWKSPGIAQPEVRPPAFRSMLRYWFRTLALGVLDADIVRDRELTIFGGIEPQAKMGMFQLEIPDGKVIRDNAKNNQEDFGLATGNLILRQSHLMKQLPKDQRTALKNLLGSLTWLMFYLGGVGQGARRPCYSRQDRKFAPWWRGSSVKLISNEKYWECPPQLETLQKVFCIRLDTFYTNLSLFTGLSCDPQNPKEAAKSGNWAEAIDSNCRIICVKGNMENKKPPALALLHREATREGNGYDRQLCGSMNERSPIWIARVGDRFDVVTIFGVTNRLRERYFQLLTKPELPITEYQEIWVTPQT